MLYRLILLVAMCSLAGCSPPPSTSASPWQEIAGRDDGGDTFERYPVYRARVPPDWRRVNPDPAASIANTTLSLCDFYIDDAAVRIAIHNFPSDSLEARIPPAAQIARWQRQLGFSSPTDSQTAPSAHGGFVGIALTGKGIMAWAMQLSPTHYRSLQLPGSSAEQSYFRQMRSDYTIKATGSQEALERHRDDIRAFALSFELIQEVPSQL